MKSLPPFFIYSACILAILLTTHIVYRTANLTAERQYLAVEKIKFMAQIETLLEQQKVFQAYRNRDYYSYEYVMKMQSDEDYSLYRDLHQYRRDFKQLQKALANFYNNHVGLWYHKQAVLPVAVLKGREGLAPITVASFLDYVKSRLNQADDYFEKLP